MKEKLPAAQYSLYYSCKRQPEETTCFAATQHPFQCFAYMFQELPGHCLQSWLRKLPDLCLLFQSRRCLVCTAFRYNNYNLFYRGKIESTGCRQHLQFLLASTGLKYCWHGKNFPHEDSSLHRLPNEEQHDCFFQI